MMIKPYLISSIPSLILGTIISLSSSSWFLAWVGLEINLMSFIPLLMNKLKSNNTENTIKYFLIQAMGSMIIIIIIMINYWKMSMNFFSLSTMSELLILSLALKSGVAPLHQWFPQVSEILSWNQFFLLLTWQKIAPLSLMTFNSSTMIYLLIFLTSIIGALSGLNQTKIKKILAYSSIMNSSWMIMAIMSNETIWWSYFLFYSFILMCLIFVFYEMNSNFLNKQMLFKLPFFKKLTFFMNLFSMAGMPPFLGFYMKISILEIMKTHSLNPLIIFMIVIMSSVISFYFYMRLSYIILMNYNKINYFWFKIKNINKLNNIFNLFINMSFFLNLWFPLMFLLT